MKKYQIRTVSAEIIVFIVLLFSYPYLINVLQRFFRTQVNINSVDMLDFHLSTFLSCGISIIFAVWTILGIFLIKRISLKARNGLYVILILLVLYIIIPIICLAFMNTIDVSAVVKWFLAAQSDRTFFTTILIWLLIDIIYLMKFRRVEDSNKDIGEKS